MTDTDRNFRAARALMVDGQVRPNNVIDERVLTAMRTLRRERFVPASLASRAYHDGELKLPDGRTLPAPLTIGRLAQFAQVRAGERVLVVGAGTGYGAAVFASCGGAVFALEDNAAMLSIAEAALSAEAPGVRIVKGRLTEGAAAHAPFDLIVIEGAAEFIPDRLTLQLADKGRMIAILNERGVGRIVLAERSGTGLVHRPLADCQASLLPALSCKPGFVFA